MSVLLVLVVVTSAIVFSRVGGLLQLSAGPNTNNTPSTSSVPSSSGTPDASSSAAPPPATFADHEHEYVKVKTYAAACDIEGYTLYECSCGKSDIRDFTEPLGHKYGTSTVVAATCTEDGWTERTCSRCKLVEKTNPTKAGHKFSLWAETDVSVGTAINEQRTCSACKLVEIQSVNSSDTWLIQKSTLDPQGTFTRYQIALNPDESGNGTTYEIYVGLSDKTLEFRYSGSRLSILYAANDTAMSYAVPSGTKIITIYSDGRATPAKPVENPEPDTPETTGPSIPETTGPAVPETTGPATPETTGPATPETTGPATPETTGPATPETTGPATPETTGPAGSQND